MPEHTSLQQIRAFMALHVCMVTLIAVEQVSVAYACMPCTLGPQPVRSVCTGQSKNVCSKVYSPVFVRALLGKRILPTLPSCTTDESAFDRG